MSGISDRLPGSSQLECPECKSPISIYTYGQARYVGCPSCHRLYKYQNQNLVHTMQFKEHVKFILPLGIKANMEKGTYILTGIATKHIPVYKIQWTEYLFFNPIHGYLSLSENSGHWMLMEVIRDYPRELGDIETSVVFRNELYHLINRDQVQTKYAVGEFPSKVHSPIKADEFIRPPWMLAREKQEDCHEWYLGKYMEPKDVQALFKDNVLLPQRVGIGAAQPSTERLSHVQLKALWAVFSMLLIIIAITIGSFTKTEEVFAVHLNEISTITNHSNGNSSSTNATTEQAKLMDSLLTEFQQGSNAYYSQTADTTHPIVTESFDVHGTRPVNLEAHFYANITNDWNYAECYLVNDNTGETTVFWQDIEYYQGFSDGEHWTEGQRDPSKTISSVNPGRYHLNILLKGGSKDIIKMNIKLVQGENIISNFWLCLLLFSLLPIALLIKSYSFEKKRWMNSDYSPYESNE